jgi:hypothetical protein
MFQVFLRLLSPMMCICNKQCLRPTRPSKTPVPSPRRNHPEHPHPLGSPLETPGDGGDGDCNSQTTCLKDSSDSTEPLLSPPPYPAPAQTTTAPDPPGSNGFERLRLMERWLARVETQVVDVNRMIGRMLSLVEHRRTETSHNRLITQEWRLVAKVLDRLFVVLYFVVIVLSILYLFPMPPEQLIPHKQE